MVKIIPQEKEVVEKESILVVLLFWFSIFLFIVSASLFLVFHLQTKRAEAELEKIKTELEKIGTPEQEALKEAIYDYKRKIDDFSYLLKNHKTPSEIFKLLEKNIHPDVWFSSFEFSSEKNHIILQGKARNFLALSQQVLIFEKLPYVENIDLSKVRVGKGGDIEFNLSFIISPDFLTLK
ncbi:MAG: PilN domain-containing protein [Candidatus Pacebacteria bacterium]|nr:PilN domain-containing protein [Candidatus Paceibacterota bacterium]